MAFQETQNSQDIYDANGSLIKTYRKKENMIQSKNEFEAICLRLKINLNSESNVVEVINAIRSAELQSHIVESLIVEYSNVRGINRGLALASLAVLSHRDAATNAFKIISTRQSQDTFKPQYIEA